MNKKELIDRIAQSTGLSKAQASRALDSTINIIRDELIDKPGNKSAKALDSTIDFIPEHLVGKKSNRALDSTIHLLEEELVTAGKVKIPGLGTFYTVARKARIGRNPSTGVAVKIPAKIVPKFKPSKRLFDHLNR